MVDGATMPVLRVESLHKDYDGRVLTRVLRGIDLELGRGEFVAMMGPSGSGKSTLLNVVGLLDRPTSGRVLVEGLDTTTLDEQGITALRGRRLGFVFQFHHLLPAFTALENVLLPAWGSAGERPDRAYVERASELLDRVGLAERKHYRSTDLSGGQQQRVAIARALVHRPALVLADEPTGNLDSESAEEVFELMRAFHRELETTFLIVTHDERIASRCDRRIDLADGKILSDQRTEPSAEPV
jgi:lipoprotein-releasing system ATP-binding protein